MHNARSHIPDTNTGARAGVVTLYNPISKISLGMTAISFLGSMLMRDTSLGSTGSPPKIDFSYVKIRYIYSGHTAKVNYLFAK